jgi:hypothetical protein
VTHEQSAYFDTGAEFSAIGKDVVDDMLKSVQDSTRKYKEFEKEEEEYMTVSGEKRRIYGVLEARWRFSKRRNYHYQPIEFKVIDLPREHHQIIIGRPDVNKVAKLNDTGLPLLFSFYRTSVESKKTSKW